MESIINFIVLKLYPTWNQFYRTISCSSEVWLFLLGRKIACENYKYVKHLIAPKQYFDNMFKKNKKFVYILAS